MLPTEPAAALRLDQIDCSARMFLVSLCLGDADLAGFGFLASDRPSSASRKTAARAALHRILAAEPGLSRRVADLLDLRHLEQVSAVRAEDGRTPRPGWGAASTSSAARSWPVGPGPCSRTGAARFPCWAGG